MRLCNRTDFQQAFLTPIAKKRKRNTIPLPNGGFRIIDGEKSGNFIPIYRGFLKEVLHTFVSLPKLIQRVIILHNAGTSQHVLGFHIMAND
jgi:hypothetical protein